MERLILPVSVERVWIRHLAFLLCLVIAACTDRSPDAADHSSETTTTTQRAKSADSLEGQSAQHLHSFFDSLAQRGLFSGVALFARNDSLLTLTHGWRIHRGGEQLSLEDQFQLASLSKPFTAFALLTLIDSGMIGLDDPVAQYVSDFPYSEVTIRQLMSHTSGLGNYAYVTDSLWGEPDHFMCNSDLLTMMQCAEVPTYFEPGTTFDYCNTNYALIAIIVEEVSGKPFGVYMQEQVFEPIGMWSSEIMNAPRKSPDEFDVIGHYPNGKLKRPFYLDGVVGDKGMYSNVFDLYKFYLELKQGSMLTEDLLTASMTPQTNARQGAFYGLGWRIRPLADGDTIVFHNGWWRGFRSYFWFSMRHNKVAVILTNSIRGPYIPQQEVWSLY